MKKGFEKINNECPNCKSDRRFCEQLGNELKERGLARPDWVFSYDVRTGVVVDGAYTQTKILAGATLPGFAIRVDICMDCGTIYVVHMRRLEGEVKPANTGFIKPGQQGNN